MPEVEKKKLCWNCDGNVVRSLSNCPYCGVYIYPEEDDEESGSRIQSVEPPYKPKPLKENEIPQAPYAKHINSSTSEESNMQEPVRHRADWKMIVSPLIFLLSGSVFFLFGFLMLLFSSNGLFTLQWNANYWYLYLLVSFPFLYFGWHTLENIHEP